MADNIHPTHLPSLQQIPRCVAVECTSIAAGAALTRFLKNTTDGLIRDTIHHLQCHQLVGQQQNMSMDDLPRRLADADQMFQTGPLLSGQPNYVLLVHAVSPSELMQYPCASKENPQNQPTHIIKYDGLLVKGSKQQESSGPDDLDSASSFTLSAAERVQSDNLQIHTWQRTSTFTRTF
jgi:hypothetical protein